MLEETLCLRIKNIFLMVCLLSLCRQAAVGKMAVQNSTAEKAGINSEISNDAMELPKDVYAPIVYQKYFNYEKELFGYNPCFKPNKVTFDSSNRPYICYNRFIQTLDETGCWIGLDFIGAIKTKYPDWDENGIGADERAVFDDNDNAYMIVKLCY